MAHGSSGAVGVGGRTLRSHEPYFSVYRVYPIVRRVESNATVTAVKSWVDRLLRNEGDAVRVLPIC